MANEQNLKHFTSASAAIAGAKGGKNKKGSKHLSTHIQEILNDPSFQAKILEGYEYKEISGAPVAAIVRVAIIRSLSGDPKWADWIAKYGYGNKMDITSDGQKLEGLVILKDNGSAAEPVADESS